MSSGISLKLEKRDVTGRKVAELRKRGIVPSVVYGSDMEPIATQSDAIATAKAVQAAGRHTPLNAVIDGKKQLVIIKSIDNDPVKHRVRHVAFHAIKQNEKIVTTVPITLVGMGESPAERAGLVILQAIEDVEVRALPADLPESLELSVAGLETDEDKLTIADLQLGEGVEFADVEQDMGLVIANVYEPSALQSANEAAGGDAEEDVPAEEGDEAGGSAAEEHAAESEKTEEKSE